ncbi:GGDEF domain-containing protein [Nocardia sp. NPDC051570]|uniref:GGDEF domain-containing protein n=1 Tax=Nocardia sp. NPDC051570 TaxID=3364324 RepID=UPI0037960CD2
MAERRSLVARWWQDRAGYEWLVDVLEFHSALSWVKGMIGAGGLVMCLVTLLSMLSHIGPRNGVFEVGCWVIVGLTAVWPLRWWLLPWPSRAESLLWCVSADIAILFGALAAEHRVYGALVTTLLTAVGMCMILHGPRVLTMHIAWSLGSIVTLAVLLMADDAAHSGAAAGDGRLAVAMILIVVSVSVIGLPTVHFCQWLWRQHALLDPLTLLLNRRGLDYQLSQTFRPRETGPAYAAALDLDRFKVVNDTFGHPFGDEVLRLTAECLCAAAGPDAVLARTGGEEFVVVGRLRDEPVAVIGERLRRAVESIPDLPMLVTASVGAVLAPIADMRNPILLQQILRRSDDAMYDAKRAGGNVVVVAPTDRVSV